MQTILETKGLSISFSRYLKGLRQEEIQQLKNVNLSVRAGEVLAIVGASGSGKSLFAHALFDILPANARISGEIYYQGKLLEAQKIKQLRGREIVLVPQSVAALDPYLKIGKQVQLSVQSGNPLQRQQAAFERYQLAPEVADLYPHEISGGMARKVLVSMAFLADPRLIIADEPTPGMDYAAVNETLKQIVKLKSKQTAIILIMHDIMTAIKIADRIALFQDGQVIELASVDKFSDEGEGLKTAFARQLWQALPENNFTY